MMKMDCLLAGVGGQGTVLASKIIAQTAINNGAYVRTSETIGMAQRGGSVVSHVRIGAEAASPAIPLAAADLLIGFEPAEAARNLRFLRPGGSMLVSVNPIVPFTASLDGGAYDLEAILAYLKDTDGQVHFIDGNSLCDEAGSAKVLNVVMLGAALRLGLLPFTFADILATMEEFLPARILPINTRALKIGYSR